MCWGRISQTVDCFTFSVRIFLYFINQVEFNLLCICVFLFRHSLPKNIAFSSFLFTFPIVFLGNSSTTRRTVGIWYGTIRPLAHCFKSTRLIFCVQKVNKAGFHGCGPKHELNWLTQQEHIHTLPGDKVTIAATLSPHSGSGLPNTAQSVMWSCERRYRSTSRALEKKRSTAALND